MKRFLAVLCLFLLGQQALAAPFIPGARFGVNATRVLTGQPSPEPTPSPAPLVAGPTPFGSWGVSNSYPTLPAQGNPAEPLYSTNAIMGWEEPPFAPMTGANNEICVMAFHAPTPTEYAGGTRNAIQKVRFYANNGSPVEVTTPALSSRSGKDMFCTNLSLSGLPNNTIVEVRAVGYPTTGRPVVLQGNPDADRTARLTSQIIVANYSPSRYYLSPTGSDSNNCNGPSNAQACLTIGRVKAVRGAGDWSNVEICLTAGSYNLSDTGTAAAANGWVIIKPCPGVAKADVTVTGIPISASTGFARFSIQSVLVRGPKNVISYSGGKEWYHDLDWDTQSTSCLQDSILNCFAVRPGYEPANSSGRSIYITDSHIRNVSNPAQEAILYRKVEASSFASDYSQNVKIIINGTVNNLVWCCNAHADVRQISNSFGARNSITYGLTVTAPFRGQLLFSSPTATYAQGIRPLEDVAFVDVTASNNTAYNYYAVQFGPSAAEVGANNNVFFWNINITSQATGNILRNMTATNWTFMDSTCTNDNIGAYSGVTYLGSASCQ